MAHRERGRVDEARELHQQPTNEPSAFRQHPEQQGSVELKFSRADGVVGSLVNFTEDLGARTPLTSDRLAQWVESKDKELERYKGTDLAYEARVTLGNFHQAQAELGMAEQARRNGNEADAQKHEANATEHFNMGVQQTHQLRRMDRAGYEDQPTELRQSMREVWATAGRGGERYSDDLYSGVYYYNDNKSLLNSNSPTMERARENVLGYAEDVARMAANGIPYNAQMAAQLADRFQTITAPVNSLVGALATTAALIQTVLSSGGRPNAYMNEMLQLKQELEKFLKKAQEKKEETSDEEKARMSERAEYAKAAEADIGAAPGVVKAGVAAIYALGLKAMRLGSGAEANVQKQLAREYAKAKPEEREALDRLSKWLSEGKLKAPEVKSMLERKGMLERLDNILIAGKKQYKTEVSEIRELDRKASEAMKKADELRKKGLIKGKGGAEELEEKAKEYLAKADVKTKALLEIAKLENDLRKSGAPEPVIKAVRASYWFYGTVSQWRADLTLKAVKFFLENKETFGGKKGGPFVKALVSFVGLLSGSKKDEEVKKAKPEAYLYKELEPKALEAGLLDSGQTGQQIIKYMKAAAGFFGTNQQKRGELIYRAAGIFLKNKDKLLSPGGKGLLAALLGAMQRLSDPSEKVDEDYEKRELDRIEKGAVPGKKVEQPQTAPTTTPGARVMPQAPTQEKQPVKPVQPVGRPAPAVKIDKDTEAAAKGLEAAGAPTEVVKAVRESANADSRSRAMMLDAAAFYSNNIKTLGMPQMEQTKKFFEDLITGLAKGDVAKEQYDKADTLVSQAKQFVSGFEKMFKSYATEANQKAIDDMEMQRSYATDPGYRQMLTTFIAEAKTFGKQMDSEPFSKDKYDTYSKKLAIVEQAGTMFLDIENPDSRKAVEPFLGRALKAATDGKFDEARLQLILAKEYLSAGKDYGKFLSSLSGDLESGKTDFDIAKAAIAEKLAAQVEKDIAGLSNDNPAKAQLAAWAASMRDKGKDIKFEELLKLSDSRSIIFDISQSDKLLSQKAYKDAREGGYIIFERTASAFTSGDPIEGVQLQIFLGRRFILNKDERPGIEKVSAGYDATSQRIRKGEIDPQSDDAQKAVGAFFAYRTLSEKYDLIKEGQRKARKGSAEWSLYDKMMGELDGYRAKIANGESISEDDSKKAEAYFVMFFGNKADMLKTFGVEADGIYNTLGHVPAADRQKAAQVGLYAFEALDKGDGQAWTIYARIGASLVSPDKSLRKDALALADAYHEGKAPPSKADWYSGAYLQKSNIERNIKDKKLLKKADEYFGQITKSYERGDLNGAQSGLDILALFGENSALGKAADKDATAYVDSFFGPNGVYAQAQKNGVTFAQAYAESSGQQYSQDKSAAIITGIEYDTKSRRMHVSEKALVKDADDSLLEKEKRKEKQYKEESSRLERRARKERNGGDETEATRLEKEASYVDYSWVKGAAENVKTIYGQGVQRFDEALDLRRKALAEPDKAQEYEAQAAEKERQAQQYISVSGTMLGGLKTFDKSVTDIYTIHRERGRENLWKGISGMSDISMDTIGTPGFSDDQGKRLQGYFALAGVGNQEVSKQEAIQENKRKLLIWFKKLEDQSKKLEEQYKDVRWGMYISGDARGGYKHNEYWKLDDPNRPADVSWNQVKDTWPIVHSDVDAKYEIDKGRAYAYAENFDNSRRVAQKVDAKLTWSAAAGWATKEIEALDFPYKKYGITEYFNIGDKQRELEVAWKEIEKGNYSRANDMVKGITDNMYVDAAKQEVENLAWKNDQKAQEVRQEKKDWDWKYSNPLGIEGRATLDSNAKKAYDDFLKFFKEHEVTIKKPVGKTDTEIIYRDVKYKPYEMLMKSYDDQANNLEDSAKNIRAQIPLIKTVKDVELGKKALGEIQSDKDNIELFADPINTLNSVTDWNKRGIMTPGGGAYLMAFSEYASANKALSDAQQGWMIIKDTYSMAVDNFLPAHYLLRTDKLDKYGDDPRVASMRWLQLTDNLALNPMNADKLIRQGNVLMPGFDGGTIGDVKIQADAYIIDDIPTFVGAISSLPFNAYARMSGENFLGYSGIEQWDNIRRSTVETSRDIIMGSWGYGFDPMGGRAIAGSRYDLGGGDIITMPEYTGAWKRMDFSDEDKELILKARTNMKRLTNEFFGDAIKMNDYVLSDKPPEYFRTKVSAINKYGKAMGVVFDENLHRDEYDKEREGQIKHAHHEMEKNQKLDKETGDFKYYSEAMDWAGKIVELERHKNGKIEEAQKIVDQGEVISSKTQDMMKDAASTEQWVGPIKIVGYGVTIVATGGAGAFVIGFRETVSSVQNFKFQAQMAGGYDNLSTKEKVLGIGGIALSALGAVSPAFSELGLATEGTTLGRVTTAMNWTLVGGGIAMSVYQLPDLYRAWQSGEMSGLAFAGNFFANMQPALQIGIFGLSPKPITNPYARFTAAILFGTPLSEHTHPLLERENYAVAYSKMAESNRTAFAELETRVGGLSNDEAIGVMKFFKDTQIPLDWAEKMVNDYRKSHALPEKVKPEQKGSLAHFEKVPLDKFAEKYEEIVAFPHVSGYEFPKPGLEKKKEEKPEKRREGEPVPGQYAIKPAAPEPKPEEARVIIEMPFSERAGFTAEAFAALHPPEKGGAVQVRQLDGTFVEKPVYHNIQHSENVAQMAHDLAMKRPFTENDAKVFGTKEEKAEFLGQVGLLHDVDKTRDAGRPARVAATIEWMHSDEGNKVMREQFGWNDTKILMAEAIIQRTEFPFDNAKKGETTILGFPRGAVPTYGQDATIGAPDNIKARYDKTSPQAQYEDYLSRMKPEERQFVMQEAPILSEYADKSSWYVEGRKAAFDSVKGLGTESPNDMFYGTNGFLKFVGQESSFKYDVDLAKKLGVDVKYPVLDEVLGLMGEKAKNNWKENMEMFAKFAKEGNDAITGAKQLMKEDGQTPLFDDSKESQDALKKIAIRAGQLAAGAEEVALTGDFPKDWNNNMASYAAADPAKFAVAEYLFDAALRKAGIDPDKVRGSTAYGDYMLHIMGSEPAKMSRLAVESARELPQKSPEAVPEAASGNQQLELTIQTQARDVRDAARYLEKNIPHERALSGDELAAMPEAYRKAAKDMSDADATEKARWADPGYFASVVKKHAMDAMFEVRSKQLGEEAAARGTDSSVVKDAEGWLGTVYGQPVDASRALKYLDFGLYSEFSDRVNQKVSSGTERRKAEVEAALEMFQSRATISGGPGAAKVDDATVAAYMEKQIKGITSDDIARKRAAIEEDMSDEGKKILKSAEAMLDLRRDFKRGEELSPGISAPGMDAVNDLVRPESPWRARFIQADAVERAFIVERISSGKKPQEAFIELAKSYEPKTSEEVGALGDRFGRMDPKERTRRLEEIAYSNEGLSKTLEILSDGNLPQDMKKRAAEDYQRAMGERERYEAALKAKDDIGEEGRKKQEISLIKGTDEEYAKGAVPDNIADMARRRGRDPLEFQKELLDAYGAGTDRQKAELLKKAGVITDISDVEAERFIHQNPEFFDLVFRGGIEATINRMGGFEGTTMTKVSMESGARGSYSIKMSNGRRLFVKMESLEPVKFGSDIAQSQGLVAPKVHVADSNGAPYSYDTGVIYKNPANGRSEHLIQEFGIMEDVHDYKGQKLSMTMPSGKAETVTVMGVAMLRDEVFENADMGNPATKAFYDMAKDPAQREALIKAWRAYQEMSRRSMLGDRYDRNTEVMLVKKPDGTTEVVFQPIDMDAIAWKLKNNGDGSLDHHDFDLDFMKASNQFVNQLSGAAETPYVTVLDGAVKAFDGKALPQESAGQRKNAATERERIIREHDGKIYGFGYDIYGNHMEIGKTVWENGGRERVIERPDGRFVLHADELAPIAEMIGSERGEADFAAKQLEAIKRLREVAAENQGSKGSVPQDEIPLPYLPQEPPPAEAPQNGTSGEKTSPGKAGAKAKPEEKAAPVESGEPITSGMVVNDADTYALELSKDPKKLADLAMGLIRNEEGAAEKFAALEGHAAADLVTKMIHDITFDKQYQKLLARKDRVGMERFVKFDVNAYATRYGEMIAENVHIEAVQVAVGDETSTIQAKTVPVTKQKPVTLTAEGFYNDPNKVWTELQKLPDADKTKLVNDILDSYINGISGFEKNFDLKKYNMLPTDIQAELEPQIYRRTAERIATGEERLIKVAREEPMLVKALLEGGYLQQEVADRYRLTEKSKSPSIEIVIEKQEVTQVGKSGPKVVDEKSVIDVFTYKYDQKTREDAAGLFITLEEKKQAEVISKLRQEGLVAEANYLSELKGLSDGTAADISKIYNIPKQEILDIYIKATDPKTARKTLAFRLGMEIKPFGWEGIAADKRTWVSPAYKGFNSVYDDNFLFGLLTSGNLAGSIEKAYPGASIQSVQYRNGAVGAYKIVVASTVEGRLETRTVYVKRQDLRPDLAGSEYAVASGIPAPKVITTIGGKDLFYTDPDGLSSRYGILEDIRDFQGTLRIAGMKVDVKTVDETSLWELDSSHMLSRFNSPDPAVRERFWGEVGYMLAGSYAVGLWDRHSTNSRAMVMEVENPGQVDPQTKLTVKQELMSKGYDVWEEKGRTYVFMVGAIDTDTAATYFAKESGGGYDFTQMNVRFGMVDLHSMFKRLAEIRGTTVEKLVLEAFGDPSTGVLSGPLGKGAFRWYHDVGEMPGYRENIEKMFQSHDGEPAGLGSTFNADQLQRIRNGEPVHLENHQNGDPYILVEYADGRSKLRVDYEFVDNQVIQKLDARILDMFPKGRDVYVFELDKAAMKAVPGIHKNVNRINTKDGRTVAIIDANDPRVEALQKNDIKMIKARRDVPDPKDVKVGADDKGIIRAEKGFGELAGIPIARAGPIPVFDAIMDGGSRFIGTQFPAIGQYIIQRERYVNPDAFAPKADVVGEVSVTPVLRREIAPKEIADANTAMNAYVAAVEGGDQKGISKAYDAYEKVLRQVAKAHPDTDVLAIERATIYDGLKDTALLESHIVALRYINERKQGGQVSQDLAVMDNLVRIGLPPDDAAVVYVKMRGGSLESALPASGPEREFAIKKLNEYVTENMRRINSLPEQQRPEAIDNFLRANDYLMEKATADPQKWYAFMADNPKIVEYALIAKRGIEITSDNISIEKYDSSKEDMKERKAIGKKLAKKDTTFEMIADAFPDRWFAEAGYKRDELIEAYRKGDYDSVDKLGKVALPHGIAISGKYAQIMAAEYAYMIRLHNQSDLTGYVVTETYGNGDVLGGNTAVFSPYTKKIFLTGAKHLARGMQETVDIVKESAVHEFQHLFDDAAGYVAGVSRKSAGLGMKGMPAFLADIETTAVAREMIQVAVKKGGESLEGEIQKNIKGKVPEQYKTAYARVRAALMTGEDGKPDPQWKSRDKEVLKARIEKLIDSQYSLHAGIRFSDLFGSNVSGVVSGEIGGGKAAKPAVVGGEMNFEERKTQIWQVYSRYLDVKAASPLGWKTGFKEDEVIMIEDVNRAMKGKPYSMDSLERSIGEVAGKIK